jgi:hypothetical protein
LDSETLGDDKIDAPGITIYRIPEIANVFNEFSSLIKKDKLVLDKNSDEFRAVITN